MTPPLTAAAYVHQVLTIVFSYTPEDQQRHTILVLPSGALLRAKTAAEAKTLLAGVGCGQVPEFAKEYTAKAVSSSSNAFLTHLQ